MRALLKTAALAAVLAFAGAPALAADAPVYKEFVHGDANAKITVIEYASLTCPHCALFQEEDYPKIKKEYIDTGKIKFVYRDFPLDGLATGGALLARCAPADRGKMMIEMMFKNQKEWVTNENPIVPLRSYAKLAGMSEAEVDACLKNETILKEIQNVQQMAMSTYKVRATPTFFVGTEQVEGNRYEDLKKAIDAALAKAK